MSLLIQAINPNGSKCGGGFIIDNGTSLYLIIFPITSSVPTPEKQNKTEHAKTMLVQYSKSIYEFQHRHKVQIQYCLSLTAWYVESPLSAFLCIPNNIIDIYIKNTEKGWKSKKRLQKHAIFLIFFFYLHGYNEIETALNNVLFYKISFIFFNK